MRETHPIDDHFREALYDASATPPAYIGEAVLAAVRAKRRAAMWRRWSIALLLLLIGGASAWLALREPAMEPASVTDVRTRPDPNSESTTAGDDREHDLEPGGLDRDNEGGAITYAPEDQGAASTPNRTVTGPASVESPPPLPKAIVHDQDPQQRASAGDFLPASAAVPTTMEPSLEPTVREFATVDRMERIAPWSSIAGIPEQAALYEGSLLARGTWWIGPAAGACASRYLWSGDQEELIAALEGSGGWSSDIAWGIFGGRTWRSGLVLSAGAEWQRTRQVFSSTEHSSSMQTTAVDLVTLNTMVFADTTWALVQEDRTEEGTDERSLLRIPLELAWHADLRRWSVGPRVGLAGEFTKVRSTTSLVWDEEEGRVRTGELDPQAARERYPVTVLGVLGMDLGYLMQEHWSLVVSPAYYLPLFDLGHSSVAHASAEHLGARVQLRYLF